MRHRPKKLPIRSCSLTDGQVAEVETLAAVLSTEQIADYFGIGRGTLYSLMERDPEIAARYKRGRARAGGSIAQSLITQVEREAISKRTTVALAAAKARGTQLGNPNGAAALQRAGKGGAALRAVVSTNTQAFADGLAPVNAAIIADGQTTLRAIASELDRRGMMTRRGGLWHVSSVKNLLERLSRLSSPAPALRAGEVFPPASTGQ